MVQTSRNKVKKAICTSTKLTVRPDAIVQSKISTKNASFLLSCLFCGGDFMGGGGSGWRSLYFPLILKG